MTTHQKLKPLRTVLLALALTFTLTASQCPTQSQLDRAAKASRTIANYTGETITTVRTLYEAGAIKLDVKDKIADELIKLSKGGKDFNDLIAHYSELYKSGGVPVSAWQDLVAHFDTVTKPFLTLLDFIPQAAGLRDSKAFRIISAAIVTLANLFVQFGATNYRGIEQKVRDYGLA